jgi:ClpP class serine protease
MSDLVRIQRLVFQRPWAITPEYMDFIAALVAAKVQSGELPKAAASDGNGSQKEKVVIDRGIAVVPISGVLMRKASWFDEISGAISYPQIQQRFKDAMASEAKVVAMKFDTPGGEAIGLSETADLIYDIRKTSDKTVLSFTSGECCSAGYFLASQADEVISAADALVGSVGVIAQMYDDRQESKQQGLDPITIKSGENKAMGDPLTIIPGQTSFVGVMSEIVSEFFATFVSAVERNRGKLSSDVLSGRIFTGAQGVKAKIIDWNGTWEQVVQKYGTKA